MLCTSTVFNVRLCVEFSNLVKSDQLNHHFQVLSLAVKNCSKSMSYVVAVNAANAAGTGKNRTIPISQAPARPLPLAGILQRGFCIGLL